MNKLITSIVAAGVLVCASVTAYAGEARCDNPTAKDAVSLVEHSIDYVKKNGKDALVAKITSKDPEFVCGELYVMLRQTSDGVMVAHPHNPKLIGKSMLDVPDVDGKMFRQEMMDKARGPKGEGWVDYKWKNPTNGQVEEKSVFIKKGGDLVYGAGYYK